MIEPDLGALLAEWEALAQDLPRALVIELVAPAGADPTARARELAESLRDMGELAELVAVPAADGPLPALEALNRGRDRLLRRVRLVLLITEGPAGSRRLRRLAPDLCAALDLVHVVGAAAPALRSAAELRALLRAEASASAGWLDLAALHASFAGEPPLPLPRVAVPRGLLPPGLALPAGGLGLLVAGPGEGKSTGLRMLALGGGPERLRIGVPLWAWAEAARLQDRPLLDFLEAHVGERLAAFGVDGPVALGPLLGQVDLLLDGLEEVPGPARRRALLAELAGLRAAHPGFSALVSARPEALDGLDGALRGWQLRRFAPWTAEQTRALVGALAEVLEQRRPPSTGGRAADAVIGAVCGYPGLHAVVDSPLLVSFLTLLAARGEGLPEGRTALYGALVELLLRSWREIRRPAGEGRAGRWGRAALLALAEPLAWAMVAGGRAWWPEAELRAFLGALPEPPGAPLPAGGEARVAALTEDAALLIAEAGGWRFGQAAFADHLAAGLILRDPDRRGEVLADPFAPRWAGALAFAFGRSEDEGPAGVAEALVAAMAAGAVRPGRYDAKIPTTLAKVLAHHLRAPPGRRGDLAAAALRVAWTRRLHPVSRALAALELEPLPWGTDPELRGALGALGARGQVDLRGLGELQALAAELGLGHGAIHLSLPLRMGEAGVDARPLLRALLADAAPEVRCAAWAALQRATGQRPDGIDDADAAAAALLPPPPDGAEARLSPEVLAGWTPLFAPLSPRSPRPGSSGRRRG